MLEHFLKKVWRIFEKADLRKDTNETIFCRFDISMQFTYNSKRKFYDQHHLICAILCPLKHSRKQNLPRSTLQTFFSKSDHS